MPHRNKEKGRANSQTYRRAHPERVKARDRAFGRMHRVERNAYTRAHPEQVKATNNAYHRRHRMERNAKDLARYHALTAEALRMLGSKCACPGCEVSEPAFLTIDHIHGRPKGSRNQALPEAKASGWDKTRFQTLCYNCNCAKRNRGFCPVHQKDPGQRNGHSPDGNAQQSLWPLSEG
jgi:5-methylcytosine-specific restriction endonuclease McrA